MSTRSHRPAGSRTAIATRGPSIEIELISRVLNGRGGPAPPRIVSVGAGRRAGRPAPQTRPLGIVRRVRVRHVRADRRERSSQFPPHCGERHELERSLGRRRPVLRAVHVVQVEDAGRADQRPIAGAGHTDERNPPVRDTKRVDPVPLDVGENCDASVSAIRAGRSNNGHDATRSLVPGRRRRDGPARRRRQVPRLRGRCETRPKRRAFASAAAACL